MNGYTDFCGWPEAFLHYISRRLSVQKGNIRFLCDEVELFGAYLKNRLQSGLFEIDENQQPQSIVLDGFQEQFDVEFLRRNGSQQHQGLSKPSLDLPHEITEVLKELRRRDDEGSRWITFSLLDMTDRALKAIGKMLESASRQSPTRGSVRRLKYFEDGLLVVVAIVGTPDVDLLYGATQMAVLSEKYRHKVLKCIGFGMGSGNTTSPFHCAACAEGPWEFNARMESYLANESLMSRPIARSGRQIGRNEPCPCGSEKKFKHCCYSRRQY